MMVRFPLLLLSLSGCVRPLPPCGDGVPEIVCTDAGVVDIARVDAARVDLGCVSALFCLGACCAFGPESSPVCAAGGDGGCTLLCFTGGFTDCDGDPQNGCETNISTDSRNCGGCGLACPPGEHCTGQQCTP